MSTHVHLIAEPAHSHSLARAIGHAHGRCAQWSNARHGLSGHLWGERYFSTALDEAHLWAAVRYVELNPVRAGLVSRPEQWPWSSARAHCEGQSDLALSAGGPLSSLHMPWAQWLNQGLDEPTLARIRECTQTGRPCGSESFIRLFKEKLNRLLHPKQPGPKPRKSPSDTNVDQFFL